MLKVKHHSSLISNSNYFDEGKLRDLCVFFKNYYFNTPRSVIKSIIINLFDVIL